MPHRGSAVRTIAASPALDVVGVGLADGRAILHNLRYDETVATFGNASGTGLVADTFLGGGAGRGGAAVRAGSSSASGGATGGAVTALSFRTGIGAPLLAAGGGAGVVTLWDLEGRKLASVIKDAHDASVVSSDHDAGMSLAACSIRIPRALLLVVLALHDGCLQYDKICVVAYILMAQARQRVCPQGYFQLVLLA